MKERTFIFGKHIPQLILLVVAVFLTASWISRHLDGFEWVSTTLNSMVFFYTLVGLMFELATEKDKATLKYRLQQALLKVLSPSILLILYFLIALLTLFVTSVTVYTNSGDKKLDMVLRVPGSLDTLRARYDLIHSHKTSFLIKHHS